MESINSALAGLDTLKYEVNVMSMNLEQKADQDDTTGILKKLRNYAPKSEIDEIKDDLKGKSSHAVTKKLVEDFEFLQKYFDELSKDVNDLRDFKHGT